MSNGIRVADTGHSWLEKYSATGGLLVNAFSEGSAVGQLKAPTAVQSAPAMSLWVADIGNNRIDAKRHRTKLRR